jgi:hypothetical protein
MLGWRGIVIFILLIHWHHRQNLVSITLPSLMIGLITLYIERCSLAKVSLPPHRVMIYNGKEFKGILKKHELRHHRMNWYSRWENGKIELWCPTFEKGRIGEKSVTETLDEYNNFWLIHQQIRHAGRRKKWISIPRWLVLYHFVWREQTTV